MAGRRRLDISSGMMAVMSDDRELQVMKDWRESEGELIYPGFAAKTEYNKQRAEWRLTTASKLKELAEALEPSRLGDASVKTQDVSWREVLSFMEKAKKTYTKKAEDNRLRGWIREGELAAGILERLTSVIPDQNGLSVLKGALAYIFQTWYVRIANAQTILQELDEVPDVLASILQICEVYSSDVKLKSLVWDFYGTLVDCLPELVAILNRTSKDTNVLKKLMKQLPQVEAARVDEISNRLRTAKQTVFEATAHLDRNIWQATKIAAIQGYASTEATRKTAVDIKVSVAEGRQENSDNYGRLASQVDGLRTEMYDEGRNISHKLDQTNSLLAKEIEGRRLLEEGLKRIEAALPMIAYEAVQGAFHQFTADAASQRYLTAPTSISLSTPSLPNRVLPSSPLLFLPVVQQQQQRQQQQTASFTVGHIVSTLKISDPTRDAEEILRKESQMSSRAVGYINLLGTKPQFSNWLSSSAPCLLLVDGNCRDEGVGRTSPMSVFTASLAATLIRDHAGIVLQFFCGQHSDPQSPTSGPKGLLRSLISQLHLYPKSRDSAPGFVDQTLFEGVAGNNTDALCFLFETLFWQTDPRTTVYMLVDGISEFESDLYGFGERLDRVFAMFRSLVNAILSGSAPGPRLKLLMTSPNRSHRLFRQVTATMEHVRLDTGGVRDSPQLVDRFWREGRRERSPHPFSLEG